MFMNPPYGKQIPNWVRKARESAEKNGALVVGLLPARTDTKWWMDVMEATEIRFIKGRVKFGDSKQCAPFPSVIAVWGTPKNPIVRTMEISGGYGGDYRIKSGDTLGDFSGDYTGGNLH